MPVPSPVQAEVLLKVGACAICGVTLPFIAARSITPMTIPGGDGHEFAGTVEKFGHGVKGWQPGTASRAKPPPELRRLCVYCRSGNYNLCPQRMGFGYGCDGAFAEYVCVPARLLHRLPDGLPFAHAALSEPAAGARNGVRRNADLQPGDAALVLGPGPIGLFAFAAHPRQRWLQSDLYRRG